MIDAFKDLLKRHWPALRLRTILLSVLLFAAAMPAVEAVWLRGYENTLVRQIEAELVSQADALAAAAAALWPGFAPPATPPSREAIRAHRPEQPTVDLNTTPVLDERPAGADGGRAPDAEALADAARMAPILDDTARHTLAGIVMLDRRGVVVRGARVGADLSALPEVRAALAGQASTVLRRNGDYRPSHALEWLSRASGLRVHHAHPIVVNGQVVGVLLIDRSPRALFRGAYEASWKIGLGAAVIISLLIGLSGLVSRGVTRPIEALSAATQAVAAGRGEVPETPPTAAVEIRALYADFRAMAQVMNRRSRYLRDFAAAVSHEFKTPLAGIGGAVELLQDHLETMSAADRERFLGNIAADNARLSQLVARLLDLARADMASPEGDAAASLASAARRVADACSDRAFTVRVSLAEDPPPVAVAESTLEAVLTTLVDNSRQAGAQSVDISARRVAGMVVARVLDDGPGVAPADRERLFEPFFTTRRAAGGTGLGLPIARSLIEAHGGAVVLGETETGALFEVSLPVSEAARGGHGTPLP